MVNKIKIITDSTADLPPDFIKENDVHVVPLYVNFTHGTYKDGVDLQPKDFYPMLLESGKNIPKTSTPSAQDFTDAYESFLKKGFDIISIHISSGLSSTPTIADSVAQSLEGNIRVFDSKSISLGIGLQVAEAVAMVKNNLSLEHIMEQLKEARQRTECFFSLDTLEYLEKGGRIGKVSALLGSVLNIKPLVRVDNGVYVPLDKARNQNQAVRKLVEHMGKTLGENLPRHVAIAHGAAEEAAHRLRELVEETFDIQVTFFQETGPVLGVHTGPGALGLAFSY